MKAKLTPIEIKLNELVDTTNFLKEEIGRLENYINYPVTQSSKISQFVNCPYCGKVLKI